MAALSLFYKLPMSTTWLLHTVLAITTAKSHEMYTFDYDDLGGMNLFLLLQNLRSHLES